MPERTEWPPATDYLWAEDWENVGFCVAVLEAGLDPEAVLHQMVPDPATEVRSANEVREWASEQTVPDYGSAIEATTLDGWVVVFEANGYQATLPEVLTRLSEGSRAVVLYRSVNADMTFMYAVRGVVVRSFDPLLYHNPNPWGGELLAEEAGLDFGLDQAMASAFACAERLTGLRLTRELLDGRAEWKAIGHYPSYSLPGAGSWRDAKAAAERRQEEDQRSAQENMERLHWRGPLPSQRLRTVGGNVIGLAKLDRGLVDAIEAADPDEQRGIARWAARRACTVAGLADVDWVRPALEALENARPLPSPFDEPASAFDSWRNDDRLRRTLVTSLDGGPRNVVQQAMALPSVWGAASPDPLRAAIDALYAAAVTYGEDYGALLADVRHVFNGP